MTNINRTKTITYAGVLIALSVIGSFIKVQGSIAFDSMPAFLGALIISPSIGGIIGIVAHFITAANSGFMLTLPIHIAVAAEMGIFTFIFGKLYRMNKIIATVVLVLLNSVGGAAIAAGLTQILGMEFAGKAFFVAMIGPLFLASLANAVLAVVIYEFIPRRKNA